MKKLPSQAALQALLDYDPESGILTWKTRGNPRFDSRFAGKQALACTDARGYPCGRIFNQAFKAHRVIWKMIYGVDPQVIDHIDRNPANNRLCNLRNGTQRDNLANRGPYRTYAGKPHQPMSQAERHRRHRARRACSKLRAVAA